MKPSTQKITLHGAAGAIEALVDAPQVASQGVAVLAHPHPLFGGTMDNKVVQTLARACVAAGFTSVRFNFRGVGASAGDYDEGRGETQDFLGVVQHMAPEGTTLVLAGFSFGSFVVSQALAHLHPMRSIHKVVLIGTAVSRFGVAQLAPELHERSLVVHGEQDDTVPLADVMDWARPQSLPVTVFSGGGHFFHGQLPLLKSVVLRHLVGTD